MVHFVGAGPGATDLITVRGQNLLKEADVIIYAFFMTSMTSSSVMEALL